MGTILDVSIEVNGSSHKGVCNPNRLPLESHPVKLHGTEDDCLGTLVYEEFMFTVNLGKSYNGSTIVRGIRGIQTERWETVPELNVGRIVEPLQGRESSFGTEGRVHVRHLVTDMRGVSTHEGESQD